MFNRWMTKLFGSEKKPDGDKTKERRHSFEEVDSPKSSYYTRSKGKKRSSPEPKRRRSDVPLIDSNNSATTIDDNVNNDSGTENTWQSMVVVKSPSPESTVIPDPPSPESTLVPDPPSPENPVVVEAQTMSKSVWENVEPSITKEHIYKDCVVIETVSEHSDRLWKESLLPFPEMPIDDNVHLSTGSFISVESMSDSGVSKEKLIVKNKNQNALIEEDTLKSSESENRKMSSSFIHVEMDEKLVQDKDSIKNVNTECKTNVENGASHNTETVNITNGVRHSNSKDEIKVKHETKEETSCQQEDAKYVVPKLPVSKGKGGYKLANLEKTTEENQDHKKEGKKQRNPEKSTTVKNEKVISKEKDSLRKEKEPSTNTVGSKDEKMGSCGNKEVPDTNAYPIKTVGKDKSTEQDGVKQKYVIPSKRNKDSAASPEKQVEYTTEPRNFVEFVERKTARRMMVDAKMLMYELGFLKDVKQTEIESAVIGQYKIATEKKLFAWIKQARYNAELIFSQTWIEENLPTLGGKKDDWKKKKQERRRGHSEYDSKPPGGMCRDVRLETDPTLQVVRENLGVQRLDTDPTLQVVRENLGVQQSPQVTCQDGQLQSKSKTLDQQHISDKENGEASTDIPKDEPRSLECKYTDVTLESNPPTVVREITSEKLGQTKLESRRNVDHSRPSRLKYTDVRLETNPNLEVVRENASDKSRSSPLKLTDIGLERNTDILVVPENTSGKTECNKNNKSESITLICGQNKLDLEEKKESLKDTRGGNSDGELRETESDNGKTEQIMKQSELIKDVNKSKPEIGNNETCEYDLKSEKVTQKSEMVNIVDMTVDLIKDDDKQCVNRSQSQSIHLDRSQPENKDLDERNSVKDKSDLESKEFSQSQSIHLDRSQPENKDLDERNSVKDKSDLESKEFSQVGTYLTYCEALKAPAKSESGTEICESTSEKEHDKNTIRKEVSNSLNSLLVLVESEISKTFDDNGNPISNNDSDELPCDGCKNGSTKADVDTEELDKTGKETKNIGSEFSGKKMTENVNASIISRVEVKKQGDGFIVNTELKGDDAELKNNMANNRAGMQSEVSNKTDIQSESSNETYICLESIKSQYVSALDLVHAQISAEVNVVGDNTKTVVLKKNYDDENEVFSVDVEKNHKMTVDNLENARKQEVKKPVEICKNKDDQLDVDISRKTKENEKNSKQFSDKSESADEQDCNGGRISLDENLNGLKNSTNETDKLHEIEIFTGLKDEAQEENLGLYERGTEKRESNANNCAVNTMSGLTKSVQSIVTDITVLETQTKLEELIKDSDLLKEEFSATEKLEGSVHTNCCDEESLPLLTQSVQSIVNVVSTIHAQKNLEKFAEDSNNIVEKLQESKTVSENFSINTNIGLETEAPMSEPTRSVQSIVNEFEDLVTNVDELLNEHSEKVYESQGSEVKTIQVTAEVHQTTIAEVKPSAEVHQTTKGQVKPSAEVHQTTKTEEVKPSAEVHQITKGEMKPSAEVHQTTKGEVKPSAEVHQTTKGEVKPSADVHQTTKAEVKPSADVHQTTEGEVKTSAEVHQTTEAEESLNAPDISKSTICDTSRPATMVTLTDSVYALVKDMETVDTQNKLESIVKYGQIHKATEDIKTEQNDNESTMISQTAQSDDVKTPSDLPMVEIIGASNSSFTADDKQHELMRTDIKSIEKGLKDIITEMAANEKCVDDFTKTACISSSLENESSANMLSPLTTIGNGHHIMVTSCEFLPKQGEQLSKSDSLENLSVKSDDGGQSKSKPERKQNSSRIQQSKKHYSPARSYDSQSKTSFKDRNWHYPSTPGRSSNNRHDGCKQPTPGRYDRSFYNSPRHYGQQDSYSSRRGSNYSEKYEHAYRGRETYSNIPRIQRQHGPNNTPDRLKHVDSHKTVDLSSKYLHRGSLSEKRSDKTTGKSSTVDKYGKTGKCENPKKLEVDKPVMENSDKGKCCGSKPKQESCDLSSEVNVKSNETRPNQSSDTVLSRSSENIPVVGKMSMEATETVASNKVGGVAENTSLSAESLNGNVRLPEKGSGKPEYSQNEGAEMKNNGSALPSKQKQKKKRRSSAKYKW